MREQHSDWSPLIGIRLINGPCFSSSGQILANEALQRELEEVISGLQEYLQGLREQVRTHLMNCVNAVIIVYR